MTPQKLLPCPFCGGKAKLESATFENGEDFFWADHKSSKCPIGNEYFSGIETRYYKTMRGAINAWSRRL